MKYLLRRGGAYMIDIVLCMLFIMVTQWVLLQLHLNPFEGQAVIKDPSSLHLWVFSTVTLPIYIYFSVAEGSRHQATVAKKWMHLAVTSETGGRLNWKQSLGRNLVKLAPWEASHFVLFTFGDMGEGVRNGYVEGNVLVGLVCLFYILYLVFSKKNRAFHDRIARTQVQLH